MEQKTIIVNLFSSSAELKKHTAWALALKLLEMGVSVECLPQKRLHMEQGWMKELEAQTKLTDALSKDVDVLITGNPILSWKLYLQDPDIYYSNMVDDALLKYNNFNLYIKREQDNITDLKIKTILLSDEVYGEYQGQNIDLMASNIKKTLKKVKGQTISFTSPSFGMRSFFAYTSLKKILSRYAAEMSSVQDVVLCLEKRNLARVSLIEDGNYRIQYEHITVDYKKCPGIDLGILSNSYSAVEIMGQDGAVEKRRTHRYDYVQQTQNYDEWKREKRDKRKMQKQAQRER